MSEQNVFPKAEVSIDMEAVTRSTVQQLAASNGMLILELNAQRAVNQAALRRVDELETQLSQEGVKPAGAAPEHAE